MAHPVFVLTLASVALALSCRSDPEPQPQYPQQPYPQQQYPQQQYPQQQYPQQQYSQPPQQQPTGGMPCNSDADLQCSFSRCIGGTCGGCITAEHCKPGASCMQTPVGMKCVPSGIPGIPGQ